MLVIETRNETHFLRFHINTHTRSAESNQAPSTKMRMLRITYTDDEDHTLAPSTPYSKQSHTSTMASQDLTDQAPRSTQQPLSRLPMRSLREYICVEFMCVCALFEVPTLLLGMGAFALLYPYA